MTVYEPYKSNWCTLSITKDWSSPSSNHIPDPLPCFIPGRLNLQINRGANLSPFGKIRRFHLEIGNSRESCRSVKKNLRRRGGVVVVSASHLSRHLQRFFSPVGNGRNGPALLCLWLAYLGVEARTGAGCLVFSLWPRKELKILCQFWSYR